MEHLGDWWIVLCAVLGMYSVVTTFLLWDARQSWIYWRNAAKEARMMLEDAPQARGRVA